MGDGARRRGRGRRGPWLGPTLAAAGLALSTTLTFFASSWVVRWVSELVALGMLVALLGGPVGRWLVEALARPVRPGSERSAGSLLAEILCPLVVVSVVAVTLHRIFLGDAPLGADHPIHLFQGWVMAEHLLPTGRLGGWVHLRGAGYPAGVLYPVGANVLIALVRYLTPRSVPWETVYAIAFFVAWCGVHLGVYTAGRLAAGRGAGLLAGLFSAIDKGAYRQSGWTFAVEWGVWPISLSMALALVGVVLLHRALVGREAGSRPALVALAALLSGASIVTHPMSVAFLGLAVPLLVAHAAIEAPEGRRPLRVVWEGVGASLLALGVAAFWLLPFVALGGEARALGTGSVTLRQQAELLIRFGFFKNLWALPAAFALVGLLRAWRQPGRPTLRLLTILLGVIAVALSGTALTGLELDRFWQSLGNLQPDRFYMYLRPMAYILAGAGLAWTVRRAGEGAGEGLTSRRRWALRIAACLAFGTFAIPLAEAVRWQVLESRLGWTGRPARWGDFLGAAEFIRRDAARRGGHVRATWPLCRVSGDPLGEGSHCFELSSAWTGIGHLHLGYHSAASFDGLFGFLQSEETIRFLGARYRVTRAERLGERLLYRSGSLRVYEVEGVAEQPFTVEGRARVRLDALEDELLRFDVAGATAGDRLVVHMPYFRRWRAFVDGEEVAIATATRASVPDVMVLPLEDGRLELRYVRGAPEIVGSLLSVLSLLLCLLLATSRRLARARAGAALLRLWRERVATPRRRAAAPVVGIGLLAIGAAMGATAVALAFLDDRPTFDTVADMPRARVWYLEDGRRQGCRRVWTGEFRCGAESHQWVGPRYVWTRMGEARGVVFAHPFEGALLHVDYPGVRLGRRIAGGMGIVHAGRGTAPVRLQVRAAGRQIWEGSYSGAPGWQPFSFSTAELRGRQTRIEFVVSSERPNGRHFVFRARVVE